MKQNSKLAFGAILMMLCLLFLTLTPAASAARARDIRRTRARICVENGIVTDDDGIIGNSATGADHARYVRRPRPAHLMTGSDIPSDPLDNVPDLPQNGTNGDMNGALGDTDDNGTGDITDGTANNDTDTLPAPTEGDPQNGTDGNMADNNDDGADNGAVDEASAAASVLPWIITIIVVLAVVLIILSLMPKKKRNT